MSEYKLMCVVMAFVAVAFSATARAGLTLNDAGGFGQFQAGLNDGTPRKVYEYWDDVWSYVFAPTTYKLDDENTFTASAHTSISYDLYSSQVDASVEMRLSGPTSSWAECRIAVGIIWTASEGSWLINTIDDAGVWGYIAPGDILYATAVSETGVSLLELKHWGGFSPSNMPQGYFNTGSFFASSELLCGTDQRGHSSIWLDIELDHFAGNDASWFEFYGDPVGTTATDVAEPSTLSLLGSALLGLGTILFVRRRRGGKG